LQFRGSKKGFLKEKINTTAHTKGIRGGKGSFRRGTGHPEKEGKQKGVFIVDLKILFCGFLFI
jgi:hypothetical protein